MPLPKFHAHGKFEHFGNIAVLVHRAGPDSNIVGIPPDGILPVTFLDLEQCDVAQEPAVSVVSFYNLLTGADQRFPLIRDLVEVRICDNHCFVHELPSQGAVPAAPTNY